MECTASEVGCSKDRWRNLVRLIVPDTTGDCVTKVSDAVMRMGIRGCVDHNSHPYLVWIRLRVEMFLCSLLRLKGSGYDHLSCTAQVEEGEKTIYEHS